MYTQACTTETLLPAYTSDVKMLVLENLSIGDYAVTYKLVLNHEHEFLHKDYLVYLRITIQHLKFTLHELTIHNLAYDTWNDHFRVRLLAALGLLVMFVAKCIIDHESPTNDQPLFFRLPRTLAHLVAGCVLPVLLLMPHEVATHHDPQRNINVVLKVFEYLIKRLPLLTLFEEYKLLTDLTKTLQELTPRENEHLSAKRLQEFAQQLTPPDREHLQHVSIS